MATQSRKFAWSYSALSRFETCPKQYREINLLKNIKDEFNKHSDWGSRAHQMLADALRYGRPPRDGSLQTVIPLLNALQEVKADQFLIEHKMAFDREWRPVAGFFDPEVWVRIVMDCAILQAGGRRAIVVDWKTGKMKDDPTQMFLYAFASMKAWPDVEKVRVTLAWTQSGDLTTETISRKQAEVWWERDLKPRVAAMEAAVYEDAFPARQSGLCKRWCPVTSQFCKYGR